MKYLTLLLALFAAPAFATGSYHHNITNNYYETTVITSISEFYEEAVGSELAGAASLSIAHGSLHFSRATKKLQLGVGAGTYDGEESAVVGLGRVFDFGLLSGSLGHSYGHNSGAISLMVTF
jgi:hypothetical protein